MEFFISLVKDFGQITIESIKKNYFFKKGPKGPVSTLFSVL